MKNGKRIHTVTLKRMVDDSPDTSWLGEYSNKATSEFSIDREHALDCPQQSYNKPTEGLELLERIMVHIRNVKDAYCSTVKNRTDVERESDIDIWTDYDDAEDVCIDAGEELEACNCDGHGDRERNEYQFFNPSGNYKDESPEDTRKYVRQDYARMESLNRGDWCFMGVRAEAQVSFGKVHGDSYLMQEVTSGGLWGIESDSGDYFDEVEKEQLGELRSQLHAIGFSQRAITAAFKSIEREGE